MCLLCSGFFCCSPLKPLTVCWSSISQMNNSKELSKSDTEMETKVLDNGGFSTRLKRSVNTSPDVQSIWRGTGTSRDGATPDVVCPTYQKNPRKNKEISKSSLVPGRAKMVVADRSFQDCGANCCIMTPAKPSRTLNKSKNADVPLPLSVEVDVRRGSDPGCQPKSVSQILKRHRKRSSHDVVQFNVSTEYIDHQRNVMFNSHPINGTDMLSIQGYQLQSLSQCDLSINRPHEVTDYCPTVGRASSENSNAYQSTERYYSMSRNCQVLPTMDNMTNCATLRHSFRRSRSSSRSESTTYRDTISEVSSFVSRHLSPILRRKNTKGRRFRSKDASQKMKSKEKGDFIVMVEKQGTSTVKSDYKKDFVDDGCDVMTQTEWNSGFETMPAGFMPCVRNRPSNLQTVRSAILTEKKENKVTTPEKQVATTSYRSVTGITRSYGTTFNSTVKSGQHSERLVGGAWSSMDNLGFLSSGESSDQTRTASTCSASNSHFRTKDDWALCKSRKSEEYRNILPRYNSDTSLDREMAQLSQEMATIQLECEVLVSRHINERMKLSDRHAPSTSSSPPLSKFPHTLKKSCFELPRKYDSPECGPPCISPASSQAISMHESSIWPEGSTQSQHGIRLISSSDEEKDSSSAYNTNESSGSTAMGVAGSNTSDEFQKNLITFFSENDQKENEKCDLNGELCNQSETSGKVSAKGITSSAGTSAETSLKVSEVGAKKNFHTAFSPGTIMYTNEAHLQHTILLQQQILRSALTLSGSYDQVYPSKSQGMLQEESMVGARCLTAHDEDSSTSKTPELEWRVKRRPDGSRYITRRPSRTKILKERAQRISEERRGLTTDDDATSEMKLGRYWSKEERKRHLERARERKRKEIDPGKSRLSLVREGRLSLMVVQEEEPLPSPGAKKPCFGGKISMIQTKIGHCTKLTRTSALLSVTTV